MDEAVRKARELLKDCTPLRMDCGKCCSAACCRSLPGEETGMLLFPTEEEEYLKLEGYTLRQTSRGYLLLCGGKCKREERPLACRIFPLLPLLREGKIVTVMDLRSRAVCPLSRQGKSACLSLFVQKVQEAGEMLLQQGEQAAFLRMLAEEQQEWKQIKKSLGG